jgi:NAD(P)-dependent dehydrogenase (short-subunit alcohol dehydrogenase family)
MAGQCHRRCRFDPGRRARSCRGIIFIGSLVGTHVPFAGASDYAGTKAAINGYARGVARDLGPRHITVNVVQPGVMPTDMMVEVLGEQGPPDSFLDMHPIRRIAALEEVAGLVVFLTAGRQSPQLNMVIEGKPL